MVKQIQFYFLMNLSDYLLALREHIGISLVALLIAMVIGIPFGMLCIKSSGWYRWITTVFNTFRIIPSLAILILLIPVAGTGVRPTIIALIFLAIPPILINTATAFHSLPFFMIEAAAGMGMTKEQIFLQVKIPLAMPLIMTGIKTATIEIIASATLAAYIGGGGLGMIIFTGLGLNRADLLLIGGVTVAILSVLASMSLSFLERKFFKYRYI